ncbi:hypothetical protein EJ06DRAFT_482490 [Trichodelitschia bisporula]|uniref:Uncharacterized protein n=1 Tax=Trichodelitschia bisporula TaxID=703511 RepID=A0A6G1HM57_9PEZI|nr:hypothetical protein EJ06DRAFT_482490 [Trichodelitschia bisporula]
MVNTTHPELYHGWKPDPNGRGTAALLYSSLVTIFLCTWSALHINVPPDAYGPWRVLMLKLQWMLLTVFAPEYTVGMACWRLPWVVALKKRLAKLQADMEKGESSTEPKSLAFCQLVIMGGFCLQTPDGSRYRLDVDQFLTLVEARNIPLPDVSERDIGDRSKADWLLKTLTIVQVLWFVVQVIGRAIQHLPVTPLELMTLAYVSYALVIYGAWFTKPKDVLTPFVLRVDKVPEIYPRIERHPEKCQLNGPPYSIERQSSITILVSVLIIGSSCVFGVFHLIAWNFFFQTSVEKMLWRISSALCLGTASLFSLYVILVGDLFKRRVEFFTPIKSFSEVIVIMLGIVYIAARLYLLGAVFADLRAVPVGVYSTVNWARYIPHI